MKQVDDIKRVAGLLKASRRVLFITGAGVSADSGLPTYRGVSGLYNTGKTQDGISIEEAISGETLKRDPAITWKYLAAIERSCRGATFNRAHEVIAKLQERVDRVWVLTQNIDGFHRAAGSRHIIDIHGDLHRLLCERCGWRKEVRDYGEIEVPPRCPKCGKTARPDVVLFGEMLSAEKVRTLSVELGKGFDVTFSVGTTSVFGYIQQPMYDAKDRGCPTVEINPERTEVSHLADVRLAMTAAGALDAIYKEFTA